VTAEQEQHATGLMIRSQQGNARAYAELLTLLAGLARRYARGRVGDVPWVDDVAQEVLLSLHAARRTYDPRRPFAPWFYAILSSRLVDVIRRERRVAARERASDSLPEPRRASPRSAAADVIDMDAVLAALEALPARQRDVVRALKLEDASVRDVGARLGMSDSAVKVTAHRGYRALRRLLGGRDT
jgi:RNA polymerase sigma-70 factor, ECF subfamily